jgi:hypothetical protein
MELTLSEHLRRLRHVNTPIVVVEGKEDTAIYNWIAHSAGITTANYHRCDGKGLLLQIFDEVQQNPSTYPNVKLFIRDRDMFVFYDSMPVAYNGMCFTTGYSIENDLYADAEPHFDNMLVYEDMQHKKRLLFDNIIKWYTFEVERFLTNVANNTQTIEQGINGMEDCKLLNDSNFSPQTLQFTTEFFKRRGFVAASKTLEDDLKQHYALKLRGHTLFDACNLLLKSAKRKIPTYKTEQLQHLFYSYAIEQNGYIARLKAAIVDSMA